MKTVHEFFTNTRMDGALFVHSWFYSWMVVSVRVHSAFEPREAGRQALH